MRTYRRSPLSVTKIKTLSRLKRITLRLQTKGKKIVFTNGCFDLLHYGHVKYLEDAKKNGDILIVALNSDASIKRIKGSARPIVNQDDRQRIIAALESVDYVVLFNDATPVKIIETLKPDIIIKGADWEKNKIVGADFVRSYGGKVKTIKFVPGRSTTKLIDKIVKTS